MTPTKLARLGLRWQGGSRDTAFGRTNVHGITEVVRACESGVALRFPPQSKTRRADSRAYQFAVTGEN